MRISVLLALFALLVGCHMRPYNPLLGKWDGAPPQHGWLLIFNNDGSFVLEMDAGGRKTIEEGKYVRHGDRVELTFSAVGGGEQRTIWATLESENRLLRMTDGGDELLFRKR